MSSLLNRRRQLRQKKQMQKRSSIDLDDYKFPGTGSDNRISTISDNDRRLTKFGAPDYNFTGNGYRFPLATIADENVLAPQRHPLDDVTSLPVVLPTFSPHSSDSISPYPSRSSGEMSTAESALAESESYVRLHRSSPLAGINAIYSSSGEYESTPRKTNSSESRERRNDVSRRSSFKRVTMTENARNLGNGSRFIGAVNEGFVSDDYYDTPKVVIRNSPLRTSLERLKREDRLQRERLPPARSNSTRKSSVLLENQQMQNGVYHVSLRHDGSAVTQTNVVKQPT